MERVIYLLGAGFSAPMGLPVMSNFLTRSKDLHANDPKQFAHFAPVFKTIRDLSYAKNYYNADLFNIEEILSILEMKESVDADAGERTEFIKYITSVVEACTPPLPSTPKLESGYWHHQIFGGDAPWLGYARFVAEMFNLSYVEATPSGGGIGTILYQRNPKPTAIYGIITLNYDSVIERVVEFMSKNSRPHGTPLKIETTFGGKYVFDGSSLPIAKLHGSIETGKIVAPTWNKNLNSDLLPAWREAYNLLRQANHLRILGYSLPTSDAYVKYLLKAAVASAPHLKTIDVICRDWNGDIKRRYEDFISFNGARFANADIYHYMNENDPGGLTLETGNPTLAFKLLELRHNRFMQAAR